MAEKRKQEQEAKEAAKKKAEEAKARKLEAQAKLKEKIEVTRIAEIAKEQKAKMTEAADHELK